MGSQTLKREALTPDRPAEHFATLEQEKHAQRLGMWIFLASEVLLFAGLFTLYAFYRAAYPQTFATAIHENSKLIGSTNTLLLITSSLTAALAVSAAQHGRLRRSLVALGITIVLAGGFLVLKGVEYTDHFAHGIYPGGRGHYFETHGPRAAAFFNLYYLLTGTHTLHVLLGMGVLGWLGTSAWRRRLRNPPMALEAGVLYWHFVDLVWIFLWPLFYLTEKSL